MRWIWGRVGSLSPMVGAALLVSGSLPAAEGTPAVPVATAPRQAADIKAANTKAADAEATDSESADVEPAGEQVSDDLSNEAAQGPSEDQSIRVDPESAPELERKWNRRAREKRAEWERDNPSRELPQRAKVLALTVSGGVSLGSYEAGMIHTLTEALRRSPGSARLEIVTGASAGSANALVGGTDACLREVAMPEESLGYRVWVNVGLDQLFDRQLVTERSIFHRDALEDGFKIIADRWQQGLPQDCDFVSGFTVTRERGYEVHLAPGLTVPRQAERFQMRVRGNGKGHSPSFSNYLDPTRSFERPYLPFSPSNVYGTERDYRAVEQVIVASAAFPVAFDASTIEYCVSPRRNEVGELDDTEALRCEVATHVDRFVDGGVFDNTPLGIAHDLAVEGLRKGADGYQLRAVPQDAHGPEPDIVYAYIDPDLRDYPLYQPERAQEEEEEHDPVLGLMARLGVQMLSSARGRELATVAERSPGALSRLWLIKASYPPISELLAAFFGFFERDFRDFDFHLGSYETFRELRDGSGTMLGVEPFLQSMNEYLAGPVDKVPARYRKLGCILAYSEPDQYDRLEPLCAGKELRNFRILLQVTIDRLWSNCRRLDTNDVVGSENLQCIRARGGLPPPQVDKRFVVKRNRYQTSKEDDFDYVMRLLKDYHFKFTDLGLPPDKARQGRLMVRRRLAEMVTALANKQKRFTDRTIVLTTGRTLVNSIEYEPPPRRVYVTLGTSIALGYIQRFGKQRVLFSAIDTRVHRFRGIVTGHPDEFSASLTVGLEAALLPFSGSVAQTALGLRGGYQFAAIDSIGTQPCEPSETGDDSRRCSQPVIQLPASMTLLERVRLAVTPIFFPMRQSWGHRVFDLELGVGAEFF